MNHRLAIQIAVLAALVLGPPLAHPVTYTFQQGVNGYTGTVDTYVRMDQPTSQFANAAIILVDNDAPIAHGLIRFDNLFGTGPGQVPPSSADIVSARLILRTSNPGDPVWFHRMLVPWNETNNWNELSLNGPGLQADEIEMSATPDFTFTGSTPIPRVDSFDVTATVRSWMAGDYPNYGWGITNQMTDGWQFDSSEHTNTSNRPLLEITWHIVEPVPRIIRQPQSSTNAEGSAVAISVDAEYVEDYQWFKDGSPISSATNATHWISVVRRADAGMYRVHLNGVFGETTSNPATLTVIPDDTPPSLLCAYGTNNLLTIFVEFSEIVTNAANASFYRLLPATGADPLTIANAAHPYGWHEGSMVILTLDSSTPLQSGVSFTLTVDPISDRFGNQNSTQQTAVAFYVKPIFAIEATQIWKYNDSGDDLSNSWREVSFDDSSWSSGLPLFGFETAPLPEPLRTPLNRTNGFGNSILTYYFRTHFFQNGPGGLGVLQFRTVLDDAAAVYLNGAEIFRIRLPAGTLDYMTLATGPTVVDAVYEGPFTVCVTNLASGDNVLAVEAHQIAPNNADLVFGMELSQMSSVPPPRLSIMLSTDGTEIILNWNGSAKLEQTIRLDPTDWTEIEGAISGHAVPLIGSKFFRLREP